MLSQCRRLVAGKSLPSVLFSSSATGSSFLDEMTRKMQEIEG